ncbi:MAG: secondary thiamine-phosphate synthase enzyme YjbQ [Candidatus Macondimonas sp.]
MHDAGIPLLAHGGGGLWDITGVVQAVVDRSGVTTGLCHGFLRHTSASLILCENADPTVRTDLEAFAARFAPDGDPRYRHHLEGPDDMPAHLRAVFTQVEVTVPVRHGRCALGTWQGIFLWEHRLDGQAREVLVTVWGT